MTNVGVPPTPSFVPSCVSAWISASYFVDAAQAEKAFGSSFKSPAVLVMYSGVSRFAFRIRPSRISQNFPCSPAQRAARAAGIACGWKSSGKSRLM